MRIVFIGPPGAGKGTQCKRISDQFGLPHISSGEMLRASKDDTEIGRLIASYIDGGNLAPDDVVMRFIIDRIAAPDCRTGYLLDGFPRTLNQAEMLEKLLRDQGQQIDCVLSLISQEEVLVDRLLVRAKIEHRDDDTPHAIKSRLEIFHSRTAPVLDFYKQQGIVREIDAMQNPSQVFEQISGILTSINSER